MSCRLSLSAAVATAALTLSCEIGALDVPIGADAPRIFYVSPLGDDAHDGTRQRPWFTLRRATRALRPGHSLALLNGDYSAETTGLLQVDCEAGARSGQEQAPIRIFAAEERRATLHGDGAQLPLELNGCSHWSVEGLVLTNQHVSDVTEGTDVGTVAMLRGGSDLTLRRLLLLRSNNQRHSHILRVLESARVLVEECEAYDFYHNAFEAVRTAAVTFRRNYFHSRSAVSSGDVADKDDPTRGEVAIQVEESWSPLLENNVAEVVGIGFSIVGRPSGTSYTGPPPYPVSGARLFGNLVRDARVAGFRVETRCNDAVPCDLPERIARDTLIVDGVAFQARTGFLVDAGPGTRLNNVTAVDVVDGVELGRSSGNAGLSFSASAARSLVRGYSGVAFGASDVDDWSFEHCAAQAATASNAVDFAPKDERVRLPVEAASVDGCVAFLGPSSPFRGAAGVEGDVGANVVRRYEDGMPTAETLWDPASGAFPCGATVSGINDDPSQSCSGVHERLGVASADCPLPAP